MATTIIKSIGSAGGRDYATIQAFLTAVPSNLVTSDEVWIGELYNDSEFSISAAYVLPAKTTDATRYIMLRPADGQGFADHANKLTNALRYDAANGVAIAASVDWDHLFDLTATSCVKIEGIQVKTTATYVTSLFRLNGASSVRNSILQHTTSRNQFIRCGSDGTAAQLIENNVFIAPAGLAYQPIDTGWGSPKIRGNTFYNAVSDNVSIYGGFGSPEITGNIVVGFTKVSDNPGTATYNASDIAGFPGSVVTIAPSDVFESTTAGSLDLRIKAGAAVINAGTPMSGNTVDAIKQTRSATTPTIGAFEVVSGGGSDATATGATLTGTSTLTAGTATGGSGGTGSFHFDDCENNTGAGILDNVAVDWTWVSGAVGSASAIANGSGTMTTAGMTVAGLPLGNGFGIIKTTDGLVVAYQQGTVT